jgi:hypothetical protein
MTHNLGNNQMPHANETERVFRTRLFAYSVTNLAVFTIMLFNHCAFGLIVHILHIQTTDSWKIKHWYNNSECL